MPFSVLFHLSNASISFTKKIKIEQAKKQISKLINYQKFLFRILLMFMIFFEGFYDSSMDSEVYGMGMFRKLCHFFLQEVDACVCLKCYLQLHAMTLLIRFLIQPRPTL